MTTPGHEFTAEHNEVFKGVVREMKHSGIVIALASVILLGYHAIDHFNISLGATHSPSIYYIDLAIWCFMALAGVVVAALLFRATGAFTAVAHTTDNDVEHLMQGMAHLRDLLRLIFWVATAGSFLLAMSFVLFLVYS